MLVASKICGFTVYAVLKSQKWVFLLLKLLFCCQDNLYSDSIPSSTLQTSMWFLIFSKKFFLVWKFENFWKKIHMSTNFEKSNFIFLYKKKF